MDNFWENRSGNCRVSFTAGTSVPQSYGMVMGKSRSAPFKYPRREQCEPSLPPSPAQPVPFKKNSPSLSVSYLEQNNSVGSDSQPDPHYMQNDPGKILYESSVARRSENLVLDRQKMSMRSDASSGQSSTDDTYLQLPNEVQVLADDSGMRQWSRSLSDIGVDSSEEIETGAIKRRKRTTPTQLVMLESSFAEDPRPDSIIRDALALKLGMTTRMVQIWYQNRRAKGKRKQISCSESPVKASFESFAAPTALNELQTYGPQSEQFEGLEYRKLSSPVDLIAIDHRQKYMPAMAKPPKKIPRHLDFTNLHSSPSPNHGFIYKPDRDVRTSPLSVPAYLEAGKQPYDSSLFHALYAPEAARRNSLPSENLNFHNLENFREHRINPSKLSCDDGFPRQSRGDKQWSESELTPNLCTENSHSASARSSWSGLYANDDLSESANYNNNFCGIDSNFQLSSSCDYQPESANFNAAPLFHMDFLDKYQQSLSSQINEGMLGKFPIQDGWSSLHTHDGTSGYKFPDAKGVLPHAPLEFGEDEFMRNFTFERR